MYDKGGAYNAKLVIQTSTTCLFVPFGPLFEKTIEFFDFGIFGIFQNIWLFGLFGYLAIWLRTKNMVKWGFPEKSIKNVAQRC